MASRPDLSSARKVGDFAQISVAAVAGLALAVTTLYICAVPLAGKLGAARDFVSYWATGRLLIQHGNPYDRDAIAALEHAQGLDARAVLIMRNPPWALPLAVPLGFLGLRVAGILWTLLLFACLLLSVRLVHELHSSPPNHTHWLGFAFTPCLLCITMGQTSLFALLGLILFLRYHLRRPFTAGLALWLCALKPHLFLPFLAVLAVWIVVSRGFRLLAGAATALAVTSLAASLLAPGVWRNYLNLLHSPAVENDFIPCIPDALRHWLAPQSAWPQYLPAALCCLWALIYYWRRRSSWNWTDNSSPLLLVSLLFAPYCWFYDQCLAMPALLQGAYAARSPRSIVVLVVLILAADLQILFVKIVSPMWLWTLPAWCAWYLFTVSPARVRNLDSEQAPV
jgi:Glycosyltransferase family 87